MHVDFDEQSEVQLILYVNRWDLMRCAVALRAG